MADSQVSVATIPERVGRYEVVLPIASGGMATVYLARSIGPKGYSRQVALKLTHAHLRDTPEFATDLLEEAKLASGVRHPNVVPVLEVDDDPLGMYLIMEYVEGETLGGLRRRATAAKRAVPRAVGIRVLLDALAGLHAAHELRDERGELVCLVHRDFSPQNIIVGLDGTSRLTDFGIAKAASRVGNTATGLVKGKVSYMAPEQARSLELDRRCDVWAAGVIAWELLTQKRLHPGEGDVATLLKVVSEEPPPVRALAPEVPPEVEAVVAKALKIDREQRYPSALAFSRDLMTACRSRGLLAEHDEVATFVSTSVGSKLAERRGRAAEVLRLRAKMGAPGSSKENDEQIAKDIQDAIAPLAEMLEPESDSDIEAAIGPLVDTRGDSLYNDTTENDAVPRDDRAARDSLTRTTGTAASVSFPGDESPTRPQGRRAREQQQKSGGPPAPWLIGAAAAILAMGIALGSTINRQRGASVAPTQTVAAPPMPVPPAVVAPPAESATASAIVPPPSASAAASAVVSEERTVGPAAILVHANAPISELEIDGRAISLAIPTREPLLELTPEERERVVRLTAHTTDGRETSLDLAAGVEEITLELPVKGGRGSKPGAPATSKPRR